jgi:hypothetical protein
MLKRRKTATGNAFSKVQEELETYYEDSSTNGGDGEEKGGSPPDDELVGGV